MRASNVDEVDFTLDGRRELISVAAAMNIITFLAIRIPIHAAGLRAILHAYSKLGFCFTT
jgi:hypothetical protein